MYFTNNTFIIQNIKANCTDLFKRVKNAILLRLIAQKCIFAFCNP